MLNNLINLFFPPICTGCLELLLPNEEVICTVCRHHIPKTNHLQGIENDIFKKFKGRLNLEHASSMLYYHKQGIVQQLIHHLKYKNRQEIGTILGCWYAQELKENAVLQTVDYIIPVPLHPKRFRERGYNQIVSFSEEVSKELGISINKTLLTRVLYNETQSKKNLINRNKIEENSFKVSDTENFSDKHFLLMDDVLTTGATLEACAKVLLQIPGVKISIITIAIAQN